MSALAFDPNKAHPLGWVKSALVDGDELGSYVKDHVGAYDILEEVAHSHNLSQLYGLQPRDIVEGNGVSWSTPAINDWVLRTGGKKLSNGQPVFASTSVIFLPPGGPRKQVTAAVDHPTASSVGKVLAIVGGGLAALGALGAGIAIWRGRRRRT